MRPISIRLLLHSAALRHPTGVDVWQSETATETLLSRVRVEPSDKVVRTDTNTELQLASVLFFDCHNSRPCGCEFFVGDSVDFDGRTYTVQTVDMLYDAHKLHHLEVGLI